MYKQRRQRIQKQESSPYCSIAGTTDRITSSLCVDGSYCGDLDAQGGACTITIGVPSNPNSRVKPPSQFQAPITGGACYVSKQSDTTRNPTKQYKGIWTYTGPTPYPQAGSKVQCIIDE